MTKAQALFYFRAWIKPLIPRGDKPALREAWNDYTDHLCKNGKISLRQYESWVHPY